jgi:hypothetical protein
MNYHEQKELELQRKENAWHDDLHPLMKMVDNTPAFIAILVMGGVVSFGFGLIIGLIFWH